MLGLVLVLGLDGGGRVADGGRDGEERKWRGGAQGEGGDCIIFLRSGEESWIAVSALAQAFS